MNVRGGTPADRVGDEFDALPLGSADLLQGQGGHGVTLRGQRRGEVFELAGEVLVDEEDFHKIMSVRVVIFC
jgi:hypothetical protein